MFNFPSQTSFEIPLDYSKNNLVKNLKNDKFLRNQYIANKGSEATNQKIMWLSNQAPVSLHWNSDYKLNTNNIPEDLLTLADVLARDTSLDHSGAIIGILASISMSLCGKVSIQIGDYTSSWIEPLIDMVIQCAHSGKGKSLFVNNLKEPFNIFLREKYENNIKNIDLSKIFLRKKVKFKLERLVIDKIIFNIEVGDNFEDICGKIENKLSLYQISEVTLNTPKIFFDGGSIPGLEKSMISTGNFQAIINSDSGDILRLFEKSSDLLLKAHTQEDYSRSLGNKEIVIKRPSLPALIFTQPNIMDSIYQEDILNHNGFLNRLIPFFNISQHPNTNISQCIRLVIDSTKYKELIIKNLNCFFTIKYSKGAYHTVRSEACSEIYNFRHEMMELSKKNPTMRGFYAKLPGQAMRFAGDIHFWMCKDDPLKSQVSKEAITAGIELIRMIIPHAQFAFSNNGLRAYNDAVSIVKDWYTSIPLGGFEQQLFQTRGISTQELAKKHHLSQSRINYALSVLEKHNLIITMTDGTVNKWVHIHPAFFNVNSYSKILTC